MNYGPLFTKYVNLTGHKPVATRCSNANYKELRTMAKNIYHKANDEAKSLINYDYIIIKKDDLAVRVFNALKTL